MESDVLKLVLGLRDSRGEKRDPTEWLDLKSRVEKEKFRKLSADLERRRARKFPQHAEEERKVVRDLKNLQRDRLRFEREKQLRQRNSFSSSRERRHSLSSANKSLAEPSTQLPMNEKSFGASASLAFDPTVRKSSRPQRRVSKQEATSYGSVRKASKDLSSSNGFPYIGEDDVQRFHKMCKSASKSKCRRWGAAWFYAKKEQDLADDTKKRWTSLLLKTEKEKMRVLSAKGAAFLDVGFDEKKARDYESSFRRKPSTGKENKNSFDGQKYPSSCSDKEKQSSNFRESGELAKDEKLTFHKAFSLPHETREERRGYKQSVKLAKDENLTFHKAFGPSQEKTRESNAFKVSIELEEDDKLTFQKGISLPEEKTTENNVSKGIFSFPPARNASKDEKNSEETTASPSTSGLASVDSKNISTLIKERALGKLKKKRSKKSRKCAEGNEYFQENEFPRMPVIRELDAEESSSTSSSEQSKNLPRRKRAVCFLPSLAKD